MVGRPLFSGVLVAWRAGTNPFFQASSFILIGQALLWLGLLGRWATFGQFGWQAYPIELALAQLGTEAAYFIYGGLLLVDLGLGWSLWRANRVVFNFAVGRGVVGLVAGIFAYFWGQDFWFAVLLVATSGLLLLLLRRQAAWTLAYPAAFWLGLFFVAPLLIVFLVSFGERTRLGTVSYPALNWQNISLFFNDYLRFFRPINGELLYLRIFGRSLWIAVLNTLICLVLGYPFAYWIARQPQKFRNTLIFLVMIPFWTNFLVRTYAWILILRDSGLVNSFWTVTLHQQAVALAEQSSFFRWLAVVTAEKLPLMFNTPAVLLGLFYGYLPFMVLPLYTNLEKLDWSLMEAAADLGANGWQRLWRVLLPLSRAGIIAGSIIVFIPSLGAYVTPDLMGGAKVALVGNLLQQQFMTVRDLPFGSAVSFLLMTIMLGATLIYFRSGADKTA